MAFNVHAGRTPQAMRLTGSGAADKLKASSARQAPLSGNTVEDRLKASAILLLRGVSSVFTSQETTKANNATLAVDKLMPKAGAIEKSNLQGCLEQLSPDQLQNFVAKLLLAAPRERGKEAVVPPKAVLAEAKKAMLEAKKTPGQKPSYDHTVSQETLSCNATSEDIVDALSEQAVPLVAFVAHDEPGVEVMGLNENSAGKFVFTKAAKPSDRATIVSLVNTLNRGPISGGTVQELVGKSVVATPGASLREQLDEVAHSLPSQIGWTSVSPKEDGKKAVIADLQSAKLDDLTTRTVDGLVVATQTNVDTFQGRLAKGGLSATQKATVHAKVDTNIRAFLSLETVDQVAALESGTEIDGFNPKTLPQKVIDFLTAKLDAGELPKMAQLEGDSGIGEAQLGKEIEGTVKTFVDTVVGTLKNADKLTFLKEQAALDIIENVVDSFTSLEDIQTLPAPLQEMVSKALSENPTAEDIETAMFESYKTLAADKKSGFKLSSLIPLCTPDILGSGVAVLSPCESPTAVNARLTVRQLVSGDIEVMGVDQTSTTQSIAHLFGLHSAAVHAETASVPDTDISVAVVPVAIDGKVLGTVREETSTKAAETKTTYSKSGREFTAQSGAPTYSDFQLGKLFGISVRSSLSSVRDAAAVVTLGLVSPAEDGLSQVAHDSLVSNLVDCGLFCSNRSYRR